MRARSREQLPTKATVTTSEDASVIEPTQQSEAEGDRLRQHQLTDKATLTTSPPAREPPQHAQLMAATSRSEAGARAHTRIQQREQSQGDSHGL
jgi:hypothetical protein